MNNSMKKMFAMFLAILMAMSMSVTAFAAEGDFTGDTMTGGNDFNYVVVTKAVYTDISGVKLSWSVPVVRYTKTDTRTWNTTTLCWEQTNPVNTEGTAVSFTLTNRGSYAVKANVSFTPAIADSASVDFGSTNDPTLATIVKADHTLNTEEGKTAEQYVTDNCSATISGTVSLMADKLSTGSGKLGTYTVSIRNTKHTVTVTYYKTAEQVTADQPATETITVNDGAEITISGHTITIGGYSFTDVSTWEVSWGYFIDNELLELDSGSTVTSDMVIQPGL